VVGAAGEADTKVDRLGGPGRKVGQSGPHRGLQVKGAVMSDKSPRKSMSKKSGKSLKEKRAEKRTKADHASQTEALLHPKKH
jgi:hypothetical protein